MQRERSQETKDSANAQNRLSQLKFLRPSRLRAFYLLNKNERERDSVIKKGQKETNRVQRWQSLALPTRASRRCHPFIAWSNSRRSFLLPVNHPQTAGPSLHLPFPVPLHPTHVRVNNTPSLCAPREERERELSFKVDSR